MKSFEISLTLMLLCVVAFLPAHSEVAAVKLNDELINNTEREGKAVAKAMYEYRRKEAEIADKNIDLSDGTMLGGKYRHDLNSINSQFEAAFSRLQSRVESFTGTREDAKPKAALIATHWHSEMYGFSTDEELDQQIGTRGALDWVVVALACIVTGCIPRRIGKPESNSTPLEVPADLTAISVPGMHYRINLLTGLVMDKEMWDEIKTTTIYYQNAALGYGSHRAEVQTQTEHKGKAFLLNQHGKEEILNLTGYGHNYRPGNIVTFVYQGHGKKRSAVIAYNHANEKTEEMRGLDEAHATYWKLNLVLTCVIGHYVFDWAAAPMRSLGVNNLAWVWGKTIGAANIFTAVLHFSILWLRNRRFRKRHQPRIENFLRNGSVSIQETFKKLISTKQEGSAFSTQSEL